MQDLKNWQKILIVAAVVVFSIIFIFKADLLTSISLQVKDSVSAINEKAAKKLIITPNQARNFLNGIDIPTRDYLYTAGSGDWGSYEADSDSLMLETRDPDRFLNNLTYSVIGDKQAAKVVELILNVNDMSFSSNSVDELIKYSDYLMYKVTGEHLTPQIKKAMQAKTSGEWMVNCYKIKLTKEIFTEDEVIEGEEPTSDHGAFSLTFLIEL